MKGNNLDANSHKDNYYKGGGLMQRVICIFIITECVDRRSMRARIEMQMPLSDIPRRIIDRIQRKHVRSILEIRLKHLDSTSYAKINIHCIRLFVAVLTDPENEN